MTLEVIRHHDVSLDECGDGRDLRSSPDHRRKLRRERITLWLLAEATDASQNRQ